MEILECKDGADWESWLAKHYEAQDGVWLKIAKKGSGATTVTITEALDGALCFGWIDSIRKSYDDAYYLQRYSPRKAKGSWSQVNIEKVERLTAAGRMRVPGLAQVEAAKADGRWEAAYVSQRNATVPDDLAAALKANKAAKAAFDRLGKTDRYLAILRLLKARSPKTRSAQLEKLINELAPSMAGKGGV